MKRVPSPDPDRLDYRGGGGVLRIIGLPFSVFGLFFVSFGVHEVQNGDHEAWIGVLLGSVFAVIGLVMLLGRSGLELDLKTRTYRRWWGLVFPWRVKTGSLDTYDRVALRLEVRTNKNQRYNVYPVRLMGSGGLRLNVGESRVYETSRGMAAELAKSLRIPLEDSTTGSDVVRDPDHVDETLRERLRREGKPPLDPGGPPVSMRTRFELDGKTIRFEIPPAGLRPSRLLPLIPFVVFELLVAFAFFVPAFQHGGWWGGDQLEVLVTVLVLLLVFFVPFILIGRQILARARTAHTLDVSPQALLLETRTPFSTRSVEISSDAILEVEVSPAIPAGRRGQSIFESGSKPAIVVRSTEPTLAFGSHLGDEEKRWIRDVIKQVVSA